MNLGETFINLNPGSPEHLWVAASNKNQRGEIVIFNFTSWRKGCDESCIINPGEHPFVKNKTVVSYQRGRLFPEEAKKTMERISCFQSHRPVTEELLKRESNKEPSTRNILNRSFNASWNNPCHYNWLPIQNPT